MSNEGSAQERPRDGEPAGGKTLVRSREPASGGGPPARKAGDGAKARLRAALLRFVSVVAIAGGLLATGVISAAVTFTLAVRSNEVTVPDLAGVSLEGARETLQTQELSVVLEGNRFNDTVPADFIALQTPAPGTTLKKGRSVRVWLSLGPARRNVPRIEGETLQSAQLILEQAGFSLGRIVEIRSDLYAPDTVVAQSPQAYDEVGDLTEVSVLLSRGYVEESYVMPDFIGRDYVDLIDRLSRSSLKVSQVRLVEYPGVPKNVVVRQVPAPGTKVDKRDRIVLYLSKGAGS